MAKTPEENQLEKQEEQKGLAKRVGVRMDFKASVTTALNTDIVRNGAIKAKEEPEGR